jgi:dTDP-4-amino-4,6-dideoxygalactose transaminase
LLDGAVESKHSFMNVNIDFKRLVKESKNDYRHWIGCYYRMKEGFNNIQLKYKLDRYELQVEGRKESASRYYNTFYRLAKLVQEYSETEEEFYTIMDKIYARHKKYIGMVKELGLI